MDCRLLRTGVAGGQGGRRGLARQQDSPNDRFESFRSERWSLLGRGGVKVGLFNRAVRVENFTLHSDSARLRLKGSPLAGLNVRVAQLSLGGIRWDRKSASMRISADDLEIISPRIVLSRSPDAEADTSAGSRRSCRDRLDSTGILAEIGRFDIRNARV